jgi:acetyl-CoA decarbonylase/synthase complex subunit gamma
MALSGLDIFKLLPKTNCKKCGRPTCIAFAMQLAQKKANIEECPTVSEEAKAALAGASAPPIRKVVLGGDGRTFPVGEETVLFRHEGKFFNPAGIAVTLDDTLDAEARKARIEAIRKLSFTRVGLPIQVDMVAVRNVSGQAEPFAAAAREAAAATKLAVMLVSDKPENMKAAAAACASRAPLIHAATPANFAAMTAVAKEFKCPIVAKAADLEALSALTPQIKAAGVEDILIDLTMGSLRATVEALTLARRAALKKSFRPLGYPAIVFALRADPFDEIAVAGSAIAKYAGVVVTSCAEPWQILPMLTVRQNIYTDPQKPIQVEAKLYAIREPDKDSPVMFTTNFSLTYYSVEGEVEASRVPSWIIAVDTEGTSVLTAYSGDKLNEKVVAKALETTKVADVVRHRKLIIPGHIAVLSGKLEEATGWEVLVGPKEASMLPAFLKTVWPQHAPKN